MMDRAAVCDYRALVETFKRRRLELGLSAVEVDRRAGLPRGYSEKIENGERISGRHLGLASFNAICRALGLGFEPVPVAEVERGDPRHLGRLRAANRRRHKRMRGRRNGGVEARPAP